MASPLYEATIASLPEGRADVVHVAVREELTATAVQPAIEAPFAVNATVPVGVGGPAGAMVAVSVTDLPAVDGFRLDASVVVELTSLTTCESVALVLVE